MKKLLLFAVCGLSGIASANAIEPQIYPDLVINWISSGGIWAGSTYYGEMALINLQTGEIVTLGDGSDDNYASPGMGNYISDNGIFVGGADYDGEQANYYKDGQWGVLPTGKEDVYSNFAQGITADGSRICGQVGRTAFSMDANEAMSTPVVWYANSDGGYDAYIELPHPGVDIEGMAPQYVTAVAISDDGKKIVGQVRSNSGRYNLPILYQEQADGSWEYRYLWPFSLDGVELPDAPGEKPDAPYAPDFMDPDIAEQYEALAEEGEYLDPKNCMTEEQYAAWLDAWDEYFILDNAWWDAYAVYVTAMEEYIDVPSFTFNNIMISANGRYVVSTDIDYDEFYAYCNVYICDTENGDSWVAKAAPDLALLATYVGNNGEILASTPSYDTFRMAYICNGINGSFVPLQDYIQPRNSVLYSWMDQNMRHDHPTEDYSTVENGWCIGTVCASADLKMLASWEANAWDDTASSYYYSYLLPMDATTAITSVSADSSAEGPVYNLQGIRMTEPLEALPSGLYITNGKVIKK